MASNEIHMTSSCRICNCRLADDSVPLFANNKISKTNTGALFEELLGIKILQQTPRFSRYICSGCDLQMKLFKRLKEKALKTLKIYESQMNADEVNRSFEVTIERERHENKVISELSDPKEFDCTTEGSLNCNDFFITEQIEDNSVYIEELSTKDSMFIVQNEGEDAESITENISVQREIRNSEESDNLTHTIEYNSNDELQEMNFSTVDFLESEMDEDFFNEFNKREIANKSFSNKEDRTFKCKECSKEFKTSRNLRSHRSQEHSITYSCSKCSKNFRSVESLEIHMKNHFGLPAFSCDLCNRTFKQKVHYQYHLRSHNNERNYKCDECEKAYVSKSDLKNHMRSHSEVRPFACLFENCGKKFYTEQHLKMHTYYHMGEKVFECNICHRKFVSPTVLHTHLRTIHSAERRFECLKCGNKFRRKHHLDAHLMSHQRNSIQNKKILMLENIDDDNLIDDESVTEPNEEYFNLNHSTKNNLVDIQEIIRDIDNDEDFIKATIESCSETDVEDELPSTLVEEINYF